MLSLLCNPIISLYGFDKFFVVLNQMFVSFRLEKLVHYNNYCFCFFWFAFYSLLTNQVSVFYQDIHF